ncbi:MAG: decaprenyl-phosphate phosphoribosyltransferase [Candidatus Omnitrophota bacterium]|jgi:4-hydroxybenzoate polyprenyltransferase
MKYLIFSLRPKHWVKNLFIFFPLIFGKKLFFFADMINASMAFLIFSLASGVVYLVNDIIDIKNDRIHPTKRLRPIASGKVKLREAKILAFVVAVVSIVSSFYLNVNFGLVIISYFTLNFIYSKYLKKEVIIDVFCISIFFLLRILAGCVVAEIVMSHWIIIVIILLALFLGFNKRRQELRILEHKAALHRQVLARYDTYFIDQTIAVITPSLVVAYTLYTVDARTIKEFGSSHLLYSIPFVYYGIFRYLYLIHRLHVDGDPVRILFSDRKLRITLLLWVIVCVVVIYFGI